MCPFPQVNRYHSTHTFSGYEQPQQAFFATLAQHGIPALYFTGADLQFLGTRDWLQTLGFSHIEGPEHPAYAGLPRGSFNDPGDAALYQRLLQWLDHERPHSPFFAVVQPSPRPPSPSQAVVSMASKPPCATPMPHWAVCRITAGPWFFR